MADVRTTVSRKPITTPPAPTTTRIYAKDGSHYFDVPPIDAKEAVAIGEYSYEPQAQEVVVESEPVADSGEQVDLEAMTKAELQLHAEGLGVHVTASMTKADMLEAIRSGDK